MLVIYSNLTEACNSCNYHTIGSQINGWMNRWMDEMGFMSNELSRGLLPTVWDSIRRLIRRQVVSQFWSLDKWRIHHFAKVPSEVLFHRKLERHCTHGWFHMHQAPFSPMVVFSQRRASNWALRYQVQRSAD